VSFTVPSCGASSSNVLLNAVKISCASNGDYNIAAFWSGGQNGDSFLDIDTEPHAGTWFNNRTSGKSVDATDGSFVQYVSSSNSYNNNTRLSLSSGTRYYARVYDTALEDHSSNTLQVTAPVCNSASDGASETDISAVATQGGTIPRVAGTFTSSQVAPTPPPGFESGPGFYGPPENNTTVTPTTTVRQTTVPQQGTQPTTQPTSQPTSQQGTDQGSQGLPGVITPTADSASPTATVQATDVALNPTAFVVSDTDQGNTSDASAMPREPQGVLELINDAPPVAKIMIGGGVVIAIATALLSGRSAAV